MVILLASQRLCRVNPSSPLICIRRIQRTNKHGITSDQNDIALITFCSEKPKILKEEIIGKMLKRRAWHKPETCH